MTVHHRTTERCSSKRPPRLQNSLLARGAEMDEEQEDDMDLENDPNWIKTQNQLRMMWNFKAGNDDEEWLIKDDVRQILEEQLQCIIGSGKMAQLNDQLVELAYEEPKVEWISRDDFVELASAYVYFQMFD